MKPCRTREQAVAMLKTHIVKNGECHEWTGARSGQGYGEVGFEGKRHFAHRLAFESTYGPIPEGHIVCHKCDNPPCCNPAHLFSGTPMDNTRDMMSKGRMATKLKEPLVVKLRAFRERGATYGFLSAVFNLPESTLVWALRNGWTHVAPVKKTGLFRTLSKKVFLSDVEIAEVESLLSKGARSTALARKFGVAWGTINSIKLKKGRFAAK